MQGELDLLDDARMCYFFAVDHFGASSRITQWLRQQWRDTELCIKVGHCLQRLTGLRLDFDRLFYAVRWRRSRRTFRGWPTVPYRAYPPSWKQPFVVHWTGPVPCLYPYPLGWWESDSPDVWAEGEPWSPWTGLAPPAVPQITPLK